VCGRRRPGQFLDIFRDCGLDRRILEEEGMGFTFDDTDGT
jgi:hypothetical protein